MGLNVIHGYEVHIGSVVPLVPFAAQIPLGTHYYTVMYFTLLSQITVNFPENRNSTGVVMPSHILIFFAVI